MPDSEDKNITRREFDHRLATTDEGILTLTKKVSDLEDHAVNTTNEIRIGKIDVDGKFRDIKILLIALIFVTAPNLAMSIMKIWTGGH